MSEEVYYCGSCNRQQRPSEGEPCKICRKQTVSWRPARERDEVARRRWKQVHGLL